FSFLERLTRGQPSESFIHVTFIISFAVVVSWTLMELSRHGMVFVTDRVRRVWMATVRLLSGLYLVAAGAIVLGFILLHSPLRELYWHLLLNKHYLILDHYFGTVGLLL